MKNYYQKIIAISYLLVVIGYSFISPLYNYEELEFGPLWTNRVDWFKFGYIFFFINLLFILLFYFFRNKPNPDVNSPTFKRKIKRELKVFAIGIIAFVAFLGFIEVFNLYQENKKEKITEEIYERNLWLSDHISKRPPIKLVDEYGIPIKKSSFTPPSDGVEVKTKVGDKKNNDWVIPDELKTELGDKKNDDWVIPDELNSERDKLFFFVRDGYTKSVLMFLIIELLVLYILRYSYYGVRRFNKYLEEE